MKSRLIRSAIAPIMLALTLLGSLTVNAAVGHISAVYSGLFTATKDSYFNITSSDCILTKVKYKDGGTTPFANASGAQTVLLDTGTFRAYYTGGVMSKLDGTVTVSTNEVIFVETNDIQIIRNFWGFPSEMWVTYKDLIYMHNI